MKRILAITVAGAFVVLASCSSTASITTSDVPDEAAAPHAVELQTVEPTCPAPLVMPAPTATVAPSLEDLPPLPTRSATEPTVDPTTLAIMAAGPTPVPTVQPTSTPTIPVGDDPAATPTLPDPADLAVGTFVLSVNGAAITGSGVAFLQESGEARVRLLAGTDTRYAQFGLLGAPNGQTHAIQSAPAVIYGGDAVGDDYSPSEGSASNATFVAIDSGEDALYGSFDMTVCHYQHSEVQRMVGVYHVEASAGDEWDCNWGDLSITNCRFLNR